MRSAIVLDYGRWCPTSMPQPAPSRRVIRFGLYEVDLDRGELRKSGLKVKLQGRPFEILAILLERPGQIVTREEFRHRIWSADTHVDFDHSLSAAINKLRQALDEVAENPRFVATVDRRGYRFIAPTNGPEDAEPTNGKQTKPRRGPSLGVGARRIPLEPVVLVVLALATVSTYLLWKQFRGPAPVPSGRIMLAVLPFDNLTGDPEQEFLSDGFTEEMITQLGSLRSERLGVIARSSVMRFKSADRHLKEIGDQLGVQYVLEGGIRRSSGRLRITAQLIRVKDQSHVWAASYDRATQDLLALEEEVATAIADEIKLNLAPKPGNSVGRARPIDPEAYEAYLKGQYFLNKRTEKEMARAVGSFQRAVEKDPGYAQGYAGLADAYVVLSSAEGSPEVGMERARQAAKKAFDLDNSVAEPIAVLALIAQNHDWNWQEAENEFKRAIALNPSNATTHLWFSLGLAARGRFEEANTELHWAQELDPLSLLTLTDAGVISYLERHPEKAIEQFNKVIDLEPNFAQAYVYRGLTYAQLGKLPETIADFEKAKRLDNSPRNLAFFGNSLALLGQKQKAERLLAELNDRSKKEFVSPWCQATVYAGLGENDAAFRWLNRAFQERVPDLLALDVAPLYDRLHSDSRFAALVRRMGLFVTPGDS
jgi:TolB-like protein/DNA-binding winged helix-turn-helix (wHTH) protein/Tfp pilus assembly protein PilF